MRIEYCTKCERRIAEEDIESGKAYTDTNGDVYCPACAPAPAKKASRTSSYKIIAAQQRDQNFRTGRRTPTRAPTLGPNALPAMPQQHAHPARGADPAVLKWTIAGVLTLVTLTVAYFAFRTKPPETPTRTTGPVAERKTDPRPTQVTPTAEPDRPHTLFEEMAKEHERAFDPEVKKARAAKQLAVATEFYQKTPHDPWTYLEMLRQVPADTPAGSEAAKALIELKVPLDKTDTAGWYRDWTFTDKAAAEKVSMHYDFGGRKNVLRTAPLAKDAEVVFHHKLDVPQDKSHLTIAARTEDNGASHIAVEVDGKQQVLEELKGGAWHVFDINLDYFKGRAVTVQLRQIANGTTTSKAYWTPPVLRASGEPGATVVNYNSKAVAYSKPKPEAVPTPPKRPFIAPASWKESPAWKYPVNLLAPAGAKDAVAGKWTRGEKGDMTCGKTPGGRLAFDYKPPAQYDIKSEFERTEGNGDVTLILSHGKASFVWQMGADKNVYFDIARVAEKKFDNPTAIKHGNCLTNKQRYTTLVEVRKDRVSAYLNGKLITEWTPDMGELSISPTWKLPDGKSLGIGAFDSDVTFYSVELVEAK